MEKRKSLKSAFLEPKSTVAHLLLVIGNSKKERGWVKIFSTGTIRARKRFSKDMAKMRNGGMIEIKSVKRNCLVKLTERGSLEYLKLKLIEAENLPEGKICMVVFDVPEKVGLFRKLLRDFLDSNYFFPIQKSVWVSHYDVAKTMSKLVFFLNLENWVRIFESQEVVSPKKFRSACLRRNIF